MDSQIRAIERRVIRALIQSGLDAGYTISVYDGEDFPIRQSRKTREILGALWSVDEEHLFFYKDGKRVGVAFLVHGNDGYDVIADYSPSIEHIMGKANEVSDRAQS